jgi:protein-S-isoprenylcysteine O-methyltransferase Ste14
MIAAALLLMGMMVQVHAKLVLGRSLGCVPANRGLKLSGPYRFVRNPMYVGVVAIVLGEALLLGAVALLWYAAVVWLAFHLFVLGYEEPTLGRSFGDEYKTYRENVPRWLPRLTAWRQTAS